MNIQFPSSILKRARALRACAVECSRLQGFQHSLADDGIAMTSGRVAYATRGACVCIAKPKAFDLCAFGLCVAIVQIICALMKVELKVKVKYGHRIQDIDDIDTLVNAIKNNPYYFFDIDIVDRTSILFPDHNKPEDFANPFFE